MEVSGIKSKVENVRGKVRWFDSKLGYGFIISNDGEDIFVHYSFIEMEGYKTLNVDEEVIYDLVITDQGKSQAHSVRKA